MLTEQTYRQLLLKARRAATKAQYGMSVKLGLPMDVDEVSLLFKTEGELNWFRDMARKDPAADHFRSESDLVHIVKPVRPVDEWLDQFHVRFEFVRLAGARWRIEAMCKTAGLSPIHDSCIYTRGSGSVVHASFKLDTEAQYHGFCDTWEAEKTLCELKCQNSYGLFSYWDVPELGALWAKPRVNVRDSREDSVKMDQIG